MQIHFSFPEGLVMAMHLDVIPRHGEIADFTQINNPAFFESDEEYQKFTKFLKLKIWKVYSVSYRLVSDEESNAIVELIEKEDSQTYAVM
ncbi:MAG: hypothetical protein ABUT20_14080 [Bacteroidota bacterium]